VDIVEAIWAARGEPREVWFCGHWGYVLDLWTDLGREVSTSSVLADASSATPPSSTAY
jgi:hypothetical protein